MDEIQEQALEKVQDYLEKDLQKNVADGKERVNKFIEQAAPRYRSIVNHVGESAFDIDPKIDDKKLELHLHTLLAQVEKDILEEGHDLIGNHQIENYSQKIKEYLDKAGVMKQSDLASYVSHRKLIIELLKNSIKKKENGTYEDESVIHNLLMPMGKDSNELSSDWEHNLWLLDERLVFHHYLGSDKTLNAVAPIASKEKKAPDLVALKFYDEPFLLSENTNPSVMASLTIVEIKRPMRSFGNDPIDQVYKYLDGIREGKIQTEDGRTIANASNLPSYCYILCDLTKDIKTKCRQKDLVSTGDRMGYFGYNKQYNAYIEVISYDKLIHDATQRNKAFFDKLSLPS